MSHEIEHPGSTHELAQDPEHNERTVDTLEAYSVGWTEVPGFFDDQTMGRVEDDANQLLDEQGEPVEDWTVQISSKLILRRNLRIITADDKPENLFDLQRFPDLAAVIATVAHIAEQSPLANGRGWEFRDVIINRYQVPPISGQCGDYIWAHTDETNRAARLRAAKDAHTPTATNEALHAADGYEQATGRAEDPLSYIITPEGTRKLLVWAPEHTEHLSGDEKPPPYTAVPIEQSTGI